MNTIENINMKMNIVSNNKIMQFCVEFFCCYSIFNIKILKKKIEYDFIEINKFYFDYVVQRVLYYDDYENLKTTKNFKIRKSFETFVKK